MEKNVGGYDRIARLVVGPILVVLGVASYLGYVLAVSDTLGYAVAGLAVLVGPVFVVTGVLQRCVLNSLVGTNTAESGSGSSPDSDRPDRA